MSIKAIPGDKLNQRRLHEPTPRNKVVSDKFQKVLPESLRKQPGVILEIQPSENRTYLREVETRLLLCGPKLHAASNLAADIKVVLFFFIRITVICDDIKELYFGAAPQKENPYSSLLQPFYWKTNKANMREWIYGVHFFELREERHVLANSESNHPPT